jgi:hypothetical protein
MSTDQGSPEIAETGAFGHPDVRAPDVVVEAGPPGVVETEYGGAAADEPGAIPPPASADPAPTTSLTERWRARIEQGG